MPMKLFTLKIELRERPRDGYIRTVTCSMQVTDGRDLFYLLDQKDLLRNRSFLSQLLDTIRRADLLSLLEVDSGPQSDSSPILSEYRCAR